MKQSSTYEIFTFCVQVPLQLQSFVQPFTLGQLSCLTGANVGLAVGASVPPNGAPSAVGFRLGASVGVSVVAHVGYCVGEALGLNVGAGVGVNDGCSVVVGERVVGGRVGSVVG